MYLVKATIVLSKDYKNRAGEELIKELQNHVKKVTAPYKYPRVIEFVEELPKYKLMIDNIKNLLNNRKRKADFLNMWLLLWLSFSLLLPFLSFLP